MGLLNEIDADKRVTRKSTRLDPNGFGKRLGINYNDAFLHISK